MKHYAYYQLLCSHPKVEKIWEWGGSPIPNSNRFYKCISVIFKDGTIKKFEEESEKSAIDKVNEYLNSI